MGNIMIIINNEIVNKVLNLFADTTQTNNYAEIQQIIKDEIINNIDYYISFNWSINKTKYGTYIDVYLDVKHHPEIEFS
jgi:hypothetical protein